MDCTGGWLLPAGLARNMVCRLPADTGFRITVDMAYLLQYNDIIIMQEKLLPCQSISFKPEQFLKIFTLFDRGGEQLDSWVYLAVLHRPEI